MNNTILGITFNKPKRCQCKNINGKTCNNKHKTLYEYNNKYFCRFHNNSHNILLINYFVTDPGAILVKNKKENFKGSVLILSPLSPLA